MGSVNRTLPSTPRLPIRTVLSLHLTSHRTSHNLLNDSRKRSYVLQHKLHHTTLLYSYNDLTAVTKQNQRPLTACSCPLLYRFASPVESQQTYHASPHVTPTVSLLPEPLNTGPPPPDNLPYHNLVTIKPKSKCHNKPYNLEYKKTLRQATAQS